MTIQTILESAQQQLEALTVHTVKAYNTLNKQDKFRKSIEANKAIRKTQTKDYDNNDVIRYEYPDIDVFAELTFNKGVDDKGVLLIYKGNRSSYEKNYSYTLKGNDRKDILRKAENVVKDYLKYKGQYDLNTNIKKAESENTPNSIKVGDVFVGTYGYDQTNVEFYQVVKLSGKSSVTVREVDQKKDSSGGVVPKINSFASGSEEYRKMISYVTGKPSIRFPNFTASLWDGRSIH